MNKTSAFDRPTFPSFDLWSLGIVIVLGGCFCDWNKGDAVGLASFISATVLSGAAFFVLVLCICEIVSGLPFSGGAYGVIRITVGFFPGFLVACTEVCYCILVVSLTIFSLASMLSDSLELKTQYNPLLMLIICFFSSFAVTYGKTLYFFWKFNNILGVNCLLLVILYLLGSFVYFSKHGTVPIITQTGSRSMKELLYCFPRSTWIFMGLENLSFACKMIPNPKKEFVKGSIYCVSTILFVSILVVVCSYLSQDPNLIFSEQYPLNAGFMLFLRCSYRQATMLSMPSTFATASGFTFSFGKLIDALSASRLFPISLHNNSKQSRMPFVAIIGGSLGSYLICCLIWFFPSLHSIFSNFCYLAAYVSYCSYAVGYISLKINFSTIKYSFFSPLGVFGAAYVLIIFFFGIVSVVFFQTDKQMGLVMLSILWIFSSCYYFTYAKAVQKLSPEEQESLMIAHVIKLKNKRSRVYGAGVDTGAVLPAV